MQIKVFKKKEDVETLKQVDKDYSTKVIQYRFRPSDTDIIATIQKFPNLEGVLVPPSMMRVMSKGSKMLFEMRNIELMEGNIPAGATKKYLEIED
jgi:hypothetical protein